ncbi:hypothetical protein ARMA_2868 [Ardenticatena maritima]|uniref:Queuosine 5'-phosphate N-glycosylase/hydrolase n=1 Tax=Ardenticatena maritima TaxID=872965 RepID=A0A0M8K9E5_9CHLR|nr:queuosine salvage family protein [Ardenticatena maritima]KPL88381.1 hypothetical protein SE16_06070 [Ardenticatena maritima]GAP64445.1 hypothetical protein ARMA_2868 [Ardenticatena maritima]
MSQNPLHSVRETTAWVAERARHVHLLPDALTVLAESLVADGGVNQSWDRTPHFADGTPRTVQYLLVLDALNFCFWPKPGLEYEHLALGLKRAIEADPHVFDAERLVQVEADDLRRWVGAELPQMEERVRLVREVGAGLLAHFGGQAANLVSAADHSAARLVSLLTAHFPGFRDHAVYDGRQVFFYKRAQIFAADVWGAFNGAGLGRFDDVHEMTMFADYRVPQYLRARGVLVYAPPLAEKVDARQEIAPGSPEEIEIRAATVQAVEHLRSLLAQRGYDVPAVQVDWLLWERAEAVRESLPPHHRTLTIYY